MFSDEIYMHLMKCFEVYAFDKQFFKYENGLSNFQSRLLCVLNEQSS